MPVARRKYDITPSEMLDLARTAVDTVVAELQRRSAELAPAHRAELEDMARHLQAAVMTAASQSHDLQVSELRQSLEAVRRDMADATAEQAATILQAVEARLGQIEGGQQDDVAAAVVTGVTELLDRKAAEKGPDPDIDGLRASVDELIERQQASDTSRIGALDRLDEVLVDLRSGITENLARQHSVLLEVIDDRLAELRLKELADSLPARIGEVISEAVERSHARIAEQAAADAAELRSELTQSLDGAIAALTTMTDELPGRLADALGTSLADAVGRHARVEKVTSELAWALGEVRGSTAALHAELARLAADLPDAAARMRDAANRSEARLADLVIRLADAGQPGARLSAGSPPD